MKTTIKIGNDTMTVLQAIEEKVAISYKMALLSKMKNDFVHAEEAVINHNNKMKESLQAILIAAAGKGSLPEGDSKAISEPYIKTNEAKMVSGTLKLKEEIEKLSIEIDTFILEVDFALSESNALTELTYDKSFTYYE